VEGLDLLGEANRIALPLARVALQPERDPLAEPARFQVLLVRR
jgi:hypothetical protein